MKARPEPFVVHVGKYRVPVYLVSHPKNDDGEEVDGICTWVRGVPVRIDIASDMSPERTLNTLLHEVTHAYLPELEHRKVYALANAGARAAKKLGLV